jgi:hypothetical protein
LKMPMPMMTPTNISAPSVTERLARGAPGLCVVMTMVLRAAQLKEGRRSVLPVVAYVKPWIA